MFLQDKEWKGRLMNIHKSMAMIVLALLPLRLGARYVSKVPAMLAGSKLEHFAARSSHAALYGFMTLMPVSGLAMGYYSGFGAPFFFFPRMPGSTTPNKELAGKIYKVSTCNSENPTQFCVDFSCFT
jgi:cytochrome b561